MKMDILFGLYGGRKDNMAKILKIIFFIIILTTISFIFTGCFEGKYINSNKIEKEQCEAILQYLDNDDVEGLKSMFCNKVESSTELDTQIQDAMDFFEGKTISYDTVLGAGGGSYKDGKIDWKDIHPHITEIVTDANKKYDIKFYSYIICESDKDKVGISEISIKSENDEECIIGEWIR